MSKQILSLFFSILLIPNTVIFPMGPRPLELDPCSYEDHMVPEWRFELALRRIIPLIYYHIVQDLGHKGIEIPEDQIMIMSRRLAAKELTAKLEEIKKDPYLFFSPVGHEQEILQIRFAENKLKEKYWPSEKPEKTKNLETFYKEVDLSKIDLELADIIIESAPNQILPIETEIKVRFDNLHKGENVSLPNRNLRFILYGVPGTGKSIIGAAIAKTSGVKCIKIDCDALSDRWVKSATKKLEKVFNSLLAKKENYIIILDEIDKIDPKQQLQGKSDPDGTKTLDRYLPQFYEKENFVLIATTNYPDAITDATKDRFNHRLIKYDLPNTTVRYKILEYLIKKAVENHHLSADCKENKYIDSAVKQTEGWSVRRLVYSLDDIISETLSCKIYRLHKERQNNNQQEQNSSSNREANNQSNTQGNFNEGSNENHPIRVLPDEFIKGFERINQNQNQDPPKLFFSRSWENTKKFCKENPILATMLGAGLAGVGKGIQDNFIFPYTFAGRKQKAEQNINDAIGYTQFIRNLARENSNIDSSSYSYPSLKVKTEIKDVELEADISGNYSTSSQKIKIDKEVAADILNSQWNLNVPNKQRSSAALQYVLNTLEGNIALAKGNLAKGQIPDISNLCDTSKLKEKIESKFPKRSWQRPWVPNWADSFLDKRF